MSKTKQKTDRYHVNLYRKTGEKWYLVLVSYEHTQKDAGITAELWSKQYKGARIHMVAKCKRKLGQRVRWRWDGKGWEKGREEECVPFLAF